MQNLNAYEKGMKIKEESKIVNKIKPEIYQENFHYNQNNYNNNNSDNFQEDNENENENENESSDDFDIDCERLTLIQVKEIIQKRRNKKNKKISFLNKKRVTPNTEIIYDSLNKKIDNSFCPDLKDLQRFIHNCKVNFVSVDSLSQKNPKKIFDPIEFMKKNNIVKTSLSIEDLFQFQNPKEKEEEIECHLEIKEIKPPSLFCPRMSAQQFILTPNFEFKNEEQKKSAEEDYTNLGKIMDEDILSPSQKNWMSKYIKYINNLPVDEIICKNKKLEIIFDLDNTCIFSFVNNTNIEDAIYYTKRYPEKNIFILDFEHEQKKMYSSIIIRKGLKEFIKFTKDFCNFHVRTLGVRNYAYKIVEKLEEYLGIQFKNVKARECGNVQNKKCIDEFRDKRINNETAIIFDDSVTVWEKDLGNVIPSKKFIDKECGVYSLKEKDKNKKTFDNDLTCILNTHNSFYYNKFEDSKRPSWKDQIVCTEKSCPFYQYKDINSQKYNAVFSGEYLSSPKLQFFYMKNVIKAIYYLVYHNDVPLFDAIKLLRLNSLNGKVFYLKYLNMQQKTILEGIVKVCGGEIINEPDESINIMMKKIFLVCSMENYDKFRNEIKEQLKKYSNFVLINEKFILDSYYFMTDLENSFKDTEYSPELLSY